MTSHLTEAPVVVVDLRGDSGDPDVEWLEGPVLVLDDVETTTDNDHVYQALLSNPQVSGVLCLAVDGGDGAAAVRVRPAPSLALVERAATIWVGHKHGIHWRPTDPVVRPVRPEGRSGLEHLVDVLGEPAAFDTVVRTISALPHSTASIGMVLARTRLPNARLRQVWDEAVGRLTDPDADRAVAREAPRGEFRAAVRAVMAPERSGDVLAPDGQLAMAGHRAAEALGSAVDGVTRLDHVLTLFQRGNRPGRQVSAQVDEARAAVRDFHEKARSLLRRVDDDLRGQRGGREEVAELGAYGPTPVRRRQSRDDVRQVVEEWLGRYRSIANFRPDLDAAKIEQEPQGCLSALEELGTRAPAAGPAPSFTVLPWPTPVIVLAALSGVLAALGVAPVAVGGVLVVLWFAIGLLLHAREPVGSGERGFVGALMPAALLWTSPLLGWLVTLAVGARAPMPWGVLATAFSLVLLVGTASLSWRLAVRRWRRQLELTGLCAWLESTTGVIHEVLYTEWRPSARRALFAEGLRQVAECLSAVQDTLTERADDLFAVPAERQTAGGEPVPALDLGVHEELCEVVLTDLVDLTIEALEPCWTGIEIARPAAPADCAKRTAALMDEYRRHVGRSGLHAVPPFAREDGSRHYRGILAARQWELSNVLDALATGADDDMTQLCHARQLGVVTAMAADARLVRFAPASVRDLAREAVPQDVPVTWTGDTEIAGTLRFVSLRHGVFE